MATLSTMSGLSPTAGAQPRRVRRVVRWLPALGLGLVVLGWHAWVADRLVGRMVGGMVGRPAPPGPAGPAPGAGLVQLRSLPALAPSAVPAPPAERPDLPQPPPPPSPRPAMAAAPAPARSDATTAAADAAPDVAADAPDVAGGEPPPRYATRPPPPVQLHYALRYGGQAGEARLAWQHDGLRYRLTLDGQATGGQPLVAQASSGALDADGLAPERFVDRRRAGGQQAANFRRDIGRIGYSGPAHLHPAWPGAQDRLSWLVQLVAILAAAEPAPDALQLFVTDALGHAGLWQLQRQPDAGPLATPWGMLPLQHWQRLPPRPEGLRVDVWLALQPDTPAGAWPLRLRFEVPRSGDAFELNLLAAP
jgi:hypothetical protein